MILTDIFDRITRPRRDGHIWPDYNRYCICNVPHAVEYLFGLHTTTPLRDVLNMVGLRPSRHWKIVLVLADAFGYNQCVRYAARHKLLRSFVDKGVIAPLTSVFPSTSSSAITTINTGLTPQEHGLPEWWVYFDELGGVIQTMPFRRWDSRVTDQLLAEGADPRILFRGTTIYERLRAAGIRSFTHVDDEFSSSAYFTLVGAGSQAIPMPKETGFAYGMGRVISDTPAPAFFHLYDYSIDTVSHDHGVGSGEYLSVLDALLERLSRELVAGVSRETAEDTIIMLVADHGQVNVNPGDVVYLDDCPEVMDSLRIGKDGKRIPPWGSARDVFIAAEDGKEAYLRGFLTDLLRDRADVYRTGELLAEGLFGRGEAHPRFRSRLGDILVLPRANHLVGYRHRTGWEFPDLGTHAGASPDEMIVPFAVARASDLLSA